MPKQLASSYEAMATGSPGFLTRAYYRIKPFIPRRLRWALRRSRARAIVRDCRSTWPIDVTSASPPAGWSGWPEGNEFAFVITHDVESCAGLEKVRDLAQLEVGLGLRSSFNFIPEGPYEDPAELRAWLEARGFEIGVHDLNHDGRLYGSRQGFLQKAGRINRHLKNWGSVGFRSGFMMRQLDWIHDLDVTYDASTFDTDPFEPQPEGSRTIFPFLVKSDDPAPGYVELPYTLPQDSTLFLLLGEETTEIWKQKLEWIARKGGLALVNIHPDYINFSGKRTSTCYPHSLVKEFLEHLCSRYRGKYWNPLAKDLACWFRRHAVPLPDADDPAC
ncbi:hypothetical protein OKA05_10040 [Luteolibacter arcticus]|uniref:NodB homology domain-containing protein n=1 Tax=Luteolibacter arcticus TaxID=1581411 RepID=A0ABT3GH07_9BACT|nr:hypothetical protein [Luteolibacter arcticus]MCW1922891.1 hypothetical protein [Luteolibacter arcticus]